MKNSQMLDIAHHLMRSYIQKDDIVIDMTMGNGHDTLFLANISKHVYAFDIQEQALKTTKKALEEANINNVTCILDSHENILDYVSDFKYVIYNLGYLPQGDKSITTTSKTTLSSLKTVLNHLEEQGMIFIMVYPGHDVGLKESVEIENYLSTLSHQHYKVTKTYLPFQDHRPPYLIMIYKQKRT